jgi:hypothetical protein
VNIDVGGWTQGPIYRRFSAGIHFCKVLWLWISPGPNVPAAQEAWQRRVASNSKMRYFVSPGRLRPAIPAHRFRLAPPDARQVFTKTYDSARKCPLIQHGNARRTSTRMSAIIRSVGSDKLDPVSVCARPSAPGRRCAPGPRRRGCGAATGLRIACGQVAAHPGRLASERHFPIIPSAYLWILKTLSGLSIGTTAYQTPTPTITLLSTGVQRNGRGSHETCYQI